MSTGGGHLRCENPVRERGRFKEQYEPSQEEIADFCQRFQAGWTESERRQRHVGRLPEDPVEWTVPELSSRAALDGRSGITIDAMEIQSEG